MFSDVLAREERVNSGSYLSTPPCHPTTSILPHNEHPHIFSSASLSFSYLAVPSPAHFACEYVPQSLLRTCPNHLSLSSHSSVTELSHLWCPPSQVCSFLSLSSLVIANQNFIFIYATSTFASCVCVIATVYSLYRWPPKNPERHISGNAGI